MTQYAPQLVGGLTFASLAASAGMGIALVEDYGKLVEDDKLKADGNGLGGIYGDSLTGVSAAAVGLGSIAGLTVLYERYQSGSWTKTRLKSLSRMMIGMVVLAWAVSVVAASLNLYVVNQFDKIKKIEVKPASGKSSKVRGEMGLTLLGLNASSLGLLGLVAGHHIMNNHRDYTGALGKFTGRRSRRSSKRADLYHVV